MMVVWTVVFLLTVLLGQDCFATSIMLGHEFVDGDHLLELIDVYLFDLTERLLLIPVHHIRRALLAKHWG